MDRDKSMADSARGTTRPGEGPSVDLRCESRQVSVLSFTLNGERVSVGARAHWSLLEVLRYNLNLTGSKQGCDKGDCGACTVQLDGMPVNSCLMLGCEAEGRRVDTVEGLASADGLHPLQTHFDRAGATQCGFCSPGMLMSADALFHRKRVRGERELSVPEINEALSGNLCRCTGYTKIIDAVAGAWGDMRDLPQTEDATTGETS